MRLSFVYVPKTAVATLPLREEKEEKQEEKARNETFNFAIPLLVARIDTLVRSFLPLVMFYLRDSRVAALRLLYL